ncbi:MAG: hypothetical protein FWE14_11305 [Lachnospiraceae bacterium]|nr:hypothetical protein [Lachnospiraceae bacterium]
MKFYKHLYIGESIKNPAAVKLKLKVNAGLFGIFIITLAEGENQLEIYHAAFLKQKLHRKYWPPYIIGIANGQEEAVNIVGKIAEECVKATGNAKLKDYLMGPDKG